MHFYIDTAKRPRLNHYAIQQEFMVEDKNKFKTIKAGEKCLVFTNGTIGSGRISYNYKKKDAIEVLNNLIASLEQRGDDSIITENKLWMHRHYIGDTNIYKEII